jgi:hypothetical protein
LWFKANPDKKFTRSHINRKKAGCGGTHLSSQQWWEAKNKRIEVQASLDKKQDPISKLSRGKCVGVMAGRAPA